MKKSNLEEVQNVKVLVKRREQFSYNDNTELQILEPQPGIFVLCKYNTKNREWFYNDDVFHSFREANLAFHSIIEKATD